MPNQTEIKTTSMENTKATADSKSNGALSQAVFQNPAEFLSVLKADASRIASSPDFGGTMTKNDLIAYSTNASDDPKGEAAAKIAANNFDTLSKLTNADRFVADDFSGYPGPSTLSGKDMQALLDLSSNNTKSMVRNLDIRGGMLAGLGALGTVMMAASTASFLEFPPLSVACGIATVGSLGIEAYGQNLIKSAPATVANDAQNTRKVLGGIAEINSGRS